MKRSKGMKFGTAGRCIIGHGDLPGVRNRTIGPVKATETRYANTLETNAAGTGKKSGHGSPARRYSLARTGCPRAYKATPAIDVFRRGDVGRYWSTGRKCLTARAGAYLARRRGFSAAAARDSREVRASRFHGTMAEEESARRNG